MSTSRSSASVETLLVNIYARNWPDSFLIDAAKASSEDFKGPVYGDTVLFCVDVNDKVVNKKIFTFMQLL